jgi:hypothetical protein
MNIFLNFQDGFFTVRNVGGLTLMVSIRTSIISPFLEVYRESIL